MPRRVMDDEIAQKRLAALALDPAELYRPVRIIHRRRKSFNEVARGLLSFCKKNNRI